MKKRPYILSLTVLAAAGILITGCSRAGREEESGTQGETDMTHQMEELSSTFITPTDDITELEEGLSIVRYEGNYGFDFWSRAAQIPTQEL